MSADPRQGVELMHQGANYELAQNYEMALQSYSAAAHMFYAHMLDPNASQHAYYQNACAHCHSRITVLTPYVTPQVAAYVPASAPPPYGHVAQPPAPAYSSAPAPAYAPPQYVPQQHQPQQHQQQPLPQPPPQLQPQPYGGAPLQPQHSQTLPPPPAYEAALSAPLATSPRDSTRHQQAPSPTSSAASASPNPSPPLSGQFATSRGVRNPSAPVIAASPYATARSAADKTPPSSVGKTNSQAALTSSGSGSGSGAELVAPPGATAKANYQVGALRGGRGTFAPVLAPNTETSRRPGSSNLLVSGGSGSSATSRSPSPPATAHRTSAPVLPATHSGRTSRGPVLAPPGASAPAAVAPAPVAVAPHAQPPPVAAVAPAYAAPPVAAAAASAAPGVQPKPVPKPPSSVAPSKVTGPVLTPHVQASPRVPAPRPAAAAAVTAPTVSKAQGDDCQRQLDASGHKVLFTDLEVQMPPIGRGAFGVVYRARFNGSDVAVKTFIDDDEDAAADFALECVNMSRLHHANIVQFIGASFDTPAIVSEYCHNGSLYDLYKKKPELLTEDTLYRIWYGSIAGFTYLHSRHVIHRDVKAGNILLTQYMEAKVADFGISRTVDERAMTKQVGTFRWTAPEVLAGSEYGVAADVYSFAIVMHETYSRQIPYEHIRFDSQVDDFVQGGGRPDLALVEACMPPRFVMIMQECWHQDAKKRPTFSALLKRLHTETGPPKMHTSSDALVSSGGSSTSVAPPGPTAATASGGSNSASKKESGERERERSRDKDREKDRDKDRGSKKEKKSSAPSRHTKSSRKPMSQHRIAVGGMSTEEICAELAALNLGKYDETFRKENISGAALLEFTEADFKELGISLGDRKTLIKWID